MSEPDPPNPKALPRGPHALPPEVLAAEHRRRLIDAAVALVGEQGASKVTVAAIASRARVSRNAFYDLFEHRHACLRAAFLDRAAGLLGVVRTVWPDGGDDPLGASIAAVLQTADADPAAAKMVFVDLGAMGADVTRAHGVIVNALRGEWRAATASIGNDLPIWGLVGAIYRQADGRLRRVPPDPLAPLAGDVAAWAASYRAVGEPDAAADAAPGPVAPRPAPPLRPLPPGPRAEPPHAVAGHQRERLLTAAAEVIASRGYAAATIGEIVSRARVSRQTFYEHFTGKPDCYRQTFEYGMGGAMIAALEGYVAGRRRSWEDGVWEGLARLTAFLGERPTIARTGLVEGFGAGEEAALMLDRNIAAFHSFLSEGYALAPEPRPPIFSELVAGAIWGVWVDLVLDDRATELPSTLPQIVYLALAPFLGAERAHEVVAERAAASSPAA